MAKVRKHGRRSAAERSPGASSSDRQSAPWRLAGVYCALAVGLSAVIVYLNAFGNEFVLDDTRIIRDNLRIRSLANVPGFFASSYWDLEGAHALYRPMVLASYALNYAMHGLSTYGYTTVNIALHAAVSLLLFALVRGIGGSLFVAAVAGIAFAVHPVHTEAVTGIAGRPELLAACFFLLAMHFHRLAPGTGLTAAWYRAGACACFACALLSKESAMTLLLVLPAMDALFPTKGSTGRLAGPRSRIVTDYLPLITVALAYLAVRRAVLGAIVIAGRTIAPLDNPLVPLTTTALGERLGATTGQAVMTAFRVVVEYARLLAWPARLSPDYSYNQIPLVTSAFDERFLVGLVLAAACVWGIRMLWRRNPVAAFGLAFLALTFSLVSNFAITIGTICAERLMYLPSAGALVAAASGAEALSRTTPRRRLASVVFTIVIIMITMGASRTWTRNREWKNDRALWSAAVAVAPGSARVQSEYGRVFTGLAEDAAQAGRAADAERLYAAAQAHYETALKIYPSYALPMDGLANILALHQRFDEALVLYERAVRVLPGNFASQTNWGALLWDRSTRTASRALALRGEGKVSEADELTRRADADFRKAVEIIDQALSMRPSYAHAHLVRALLLDGYLGNPTGAIAEFEEVLRLMPAHPQRAVIEKELLRLRAPQSSGTVEK
jgi:tetratricopeptide (TPR) repeat protein